MSNEKTKILSVIIPVYGVEEYIAETIDSVIKQTIGFEDNIELILINDGSPDNSDIVCKEYAEKYPNNIHYIEQDNAGVSATRNNGLRLATSKYVHCLDSDDILAKDAYQQTINFLETHPEIDFATMSLEFFDAQLGEHPLNYKFSKGDQVIDINSEPNALVFHAAATVFVREKIKHSFDSNIKISEDVKFLAEQLTENSKYGVVASATYFYRRRSNGLSAITGAQLNPTFYTVTPHKVYEYLFTFMRSGDKPHRYVQSAVMYDLQWRIRQKTQDVLSDEEERVYRDTILSLIKSIDDDIILAQKHINLAYKLYALRKKYGSIKRIPQSTREVIQSRIEQDSPSVIIEFIEDRGDVMEVEGRVPDGSELHNITLTCNGKKIDLTKNNVQFRVNTFLGDEVYEGNVFSAKIPKEIFKDEVSLVFKNYKNVLRTVPKRQSRLPDVRYGYTIYAQKDRIWINRRHDLRVIPYSALKHVLLELIRFVRILVALRLRRSARQLRLVWRSHLKRSIAPSQVIKPLVAPIIDLFRNIHDIVWRCIYACYRPSRPIWIISDRFLAGGDNGEALFRHIIKKEESEAKVYFAISRESKDYDRLRNEFGNKIINNATLMYKLRFLRASKIISSHADDFVINPFNWRVKNFYDLFQFDFVFLQHGVTRNDMSGWLNRYNKNIKLFITVSQQEYQSIFDYNYYYRPEQVLLSGFPRFDLLSNKPKNKLVLAPTWRDSMAAKTSDASGNRKYLEGFKETEYFQFYNTLMNSSEMLQFLKKYNLEGELYLHPSFQPQIVDFTENDQFKVKSFPYDYKVAFQEGTVMVTDYSSVFFDFVYLNKPVVFSQFDRDHIFDIHLYQPGYIDDVKNGFGPVVETIGDVVKSLEEIAKNNFSLLPTYQKRVDNFFEYRDKNNSKRVYDAIVEM